MKVSITREIDFFEVDPGLTLKVEALSKIFQGMATLHSEQVGVGARELFQQGLTWFLSRLAVEIHRYPRLGEKIRVETWSRGFDNYKGFREYSVLVGDEEIACGSSVWALLDLRKKKVTRVPEALAARYGYEERSLFSQELKDWKAPGKITPESVTDITLRLSDFDMNGHVNNTVYLNFIETMIYKTISRESGRIKDIRIRFAHEISGATEKVSAGWQRETGGYTYNIFNGDTLFADGDIHMHTPKGS